MSFSAKIWIGADPGGTANFGLAIPKSDGSAYTCCVNCADEAIGVVMEQVKVQPAGVGVDSPLWWSSGRSSDRQADQWLRRTYSLSGGQVQTANSLRGAALVQGAMFVHRVRQLFPDVGVTEAHPKAVWNALRVDNWDTFSRQFSIKVPIQAEQEHERDAIISAVAAREGFERRWLKDLSTARHPCEQDPSQFWLAPIHYFWPDK
jgi:predicted nuclease with RNAse H fold